MTEQREPWLEQHDRHVMVSATREFLAEDPDPGEVWGRDRHRGQLPNRPWRLHRSRSRTIEQRKSHGVCPVRGKHEAF
jgi:hypothetical protein